MTGDLGKGLLRAMARNALLANHRLHAACARLDAAQQAADRRLLALVERADERALAAPVRYTRPSGVACVNPLSAVLLHAFLHDVHHRGQVHDMLSQTEVAPLQLDEFVLSEDAALRVEEMAALGLAEPEPA